ncbi:hypothetical protein PC123_g22561 [Phytophthora cactorum]|nr:hypothetical protein PC123_g22561 [Phytophthora cactorum]
MVRNRRVRTREEIEEDLRQNERDNAAPDVLADRAAKRRRQSPLSSNKCRLNKELATLIAFGNVENSASSESNPQEQQASQSGAERVRRHRERLTPEEPATVQHENTQRRQELRASQTPEQQAAEVRLNSQRRQDVMTPDEQALNGNATRMGGMSCGLHRRWNSKSLTGN